MAVETYDDMVRRAVRAQQAKDLDAAEALYRSALAKHPERAEALHYLGLLLDQRGAHAEAIALVERSLALAPDRAAFHCNFGGVLDRAGRAEAAVDAYGRALALRPDYALALERLGHLCYRLGRFADAERAFAALTRLRPDRVDALGELSKCLIQQARFAEAETACRRIVALAPRSSTGHYALAMSLMIQEKLGEGFDEYEWRWQTLRFPSTRRPFAAPPWDGAPLDDGVLLLWGEQGAGDEILHAGLVEEAAARAGRCQLECDARLVPLLARSFPAIAVVPRRMPPHPKTSDAAIARQAPIGSLPRLLRRRLADFPARPSYLAADRDRVEALRAGYRARGRGPLIGLAWRSKATKAGAAKSTALLDWAPILTTPGVTFVNLQYGDCAPELAAIEGALGVSVHHDGTIDQMHDLDGFAAQVAALDLVISVSNTTVHFAGALGTPCWVLLPAGPGLIWYWFLDREDSPWYASLRLFRQLSPGAWAPVLERVAGELRRLTADNTP